MAFCSCRSDNFLALPLPFRPDLAQLQRLSAAAWLEVASRGSKSRPPSRRSSAHRGCWTAAPNYWPRREASLRGLRGSAAASCWQLCPGKGLGGAAGFCLGHLGRLAWTLRARALLLACLPTAQSLPWSHAQHTHTCQPSLISVDVQSWAKEPCNAHFACLLGREAAFFRGRLPVPHQRAQHGTWAAVVSCQDRCQPAQWPAWLSPRKDMLGLGWGQGGVRAREQSQN